MRDPIELDGVIKYRSSRETMMVGRGVSLDGRLFLGGTDGSNPVPSSGESTNFRFLSIPPAADRGGLVLPLPMSVEGQLPGFAGLTDVQLAARLVGRWPSG